MQIVEFLTRRETVKYALILYYTQYVVLLGTALYFAYHGPNGYSWIHNDISDLMNSEYTKYPNIYVAHCVLSSIFSIPFSVCVYKLITPFPRTKEEKTNHKYQFPLAATSIFFTIIAHVAHIGVGIWDLDMPYIGTFDMHTFTGTLTFLGYIFAAMFCGFLILGYDVIFPKSFGYYAAIVPIMSSIVFGFIRTNPSREHYSSGFEWIMLLTIFIWTLMLWVYILRNSIKGKEIKVENMK